MGRKALNEAEHLLHDRAASEHPAEFQLMDDGAFEGDDLRAPAKLVADAAEHGPQAIEVEGLREVLARAELDRLDRAVDGGMARHQNHFAPRHGAANLAQQIEAVHIRHAQVDHREVRWLAKQEAHGFGAARARPHFKARLVREAFNQLQHWQFVIDDKQRRLRGNRPVSGDG